MDHVNLLGEKGRSSSTNKKLTYKGCKFHRVVKNLMLQAGDFTEGNLAVTSSLFLVFFSEDRCFSFARMVLPCFSSNWRMMAGQRFRWGVVLDVLLHLSFSWASITRIEMISMYEKRMHFFSVDLVFSIPGNGSGGESIYGGSFPGKWSNSVRPDLRHRCRSRWKFSSQTRSTVSAFDGKSGPGHERITISHVRSSNDDARPSLRSSRLEPPPSLLISMGKPFSNGRSTSFERFESICSSKHVVFGHVLSGQTIVDSIEKLPVDPETNRPLKDALISNCGQFEMNSSNWPVSFSSFAHRFVLLV